MAGSPGSLQASAIDTFVKIIATRNAARTIRLFVQTRSRGSSVVVIEDAPKVCPQGARVVELIHRSRRRSEGAA